MDNVYVQQNIYAFVKEYTLSHTYTYIVIKRITEHKQVPNLVKFYRNNRRKRRIRNYEQIIKQHRRHYTFIESSKERPEGDG